MGCLKEQSLWPVWVISIWVTVVASSEDVIYKDKAICSEPQGHSVEEPRCPNYYPNCFEHEYC